MTTAIAPLPGFGSTFSSLAGFYAADARASYPWTYRLTFCKLCLSSITTEQ